MKSPNQEHMNSTKVLSKLPYTKPFLFVDELVEIDQNGAKGSYTFPEDAFFYEGHFKDFPVTPGVILTECAAQIGVVCLGIYLCFQENDLEEEDLQLALSSTEMEFYLPVFPGEKVVVQSKKTYFRFQKLKCEVRMYNAEEKLICKGSIAGMIKTGK